MLEPIGSKIEAVSLPPPIVAPVSTAPPRKERKGVHSRRVSVAKIGAYIAELERYKRRGRSVRLLISAALFGVIVLMLALLALTAPVEVLVVGVVFAAIGLLLFGFWFFSWRSTQKQIAARRLQPLCSILAALHEDLLPT